MIDSDITITGLGCISALGNSVSDNWNNLKDGHVGISPIQQIDNSLLKIKNAAEVKYTPTDYFEPKELRILDRFTQFSLIAASEAIDDSKLNTRKYSARIGIILGTGVGARNTNDEALHQFHSSSSNNIHPLSIPKGLFNAPASFISMKYGITGPSFMVTSACSSSNQAISVASDMIKNGVIDIAITGGTEACITLPFFKGWEALRIMDADTCCPFSIGRKGLVLGEGAGIIVLESSSSAHRRKARIYGKITGYGMSSDAFDIIKPSDIGAVSALQNALENANLKPEDIGYINAHGTGTILNDKIETQAIHTVFRQHASKLLISSTKSMHGHALGAAGALEAIATIKALNEQYVPPTANYTAPDPDCNLNYVPNFGEELKFGHAMSTSLAFGGINCVLVMSNVG